MIIRKSCVCATLTLCLIAGCCATTGLLIDKLKYGDRRAKWKAARTLGERRDERAIKPLIEALNTNDKWVHGAVANALAEIGAPCFDTVIQAIKSDSKTVRSGAAYVLGSIGDDRACETLISALADECWEVRGSAAWALGSLGNSRTVGPFIQTLKDKEEGVRLAAAYSLGMIGDPRAVEPLIKALKDKYNSVRRNASHALGDLGNDKALVSLIELLDDELVCTAAAEALGKIGSSMAIVPLVRALTDKSWDVRATVARALGEIGDKRAIVPLRKLWREDKDEDVRLSAACALGNIVIDKNMYASLRRALKICDYRVRWLATRALARMGYKGAICSVITKLKHDRIFMRKSAAEILGEIGNKQAIQPLIDTLKDRDWRVRSVAAESLRNTTQENFAEDYEKWKAWYEKSKDE